MGIAVTTLNGQPVTDEVLTPGNSNQQASVEYGTYDVGDLLEDGDNMLAVELGHGTAFSHRIPNPSTGRTDPFARLGGVAADPTMATSEVAQGDTSIEVESSEGFEPGQTINIDTRDGGERLEWKRIEEVSGNVVTFSPAAEVEHDAGAVVTRSGGPLDVSTRITPRLLARLEIDYSDGTQDVIVSDRSWRTALGPNTSENWFSGVDYDARLEQPGWNLPGADISANALRRDGEPAVWVDAGFAPPPSLDTELVFRQAEGIRIVDEFPAVSVRETVPGTWLFDVGQGSAGFIQLNAPSSLPAGTTIRMEPGEMLLEDGTVDPMTMIEGNIDANGRDLFNTYTTWGDPDGETWYPPFKYDGLQYVQMTGLPEGFVPTTDMITAIQVSATPPDAGSIETDNDRINRINRINRMSHYSIMSNMLSIFTDCPNREKAGWLADMIQSMPAIDKHYDMGAYLRTMQRHMDEGQAKTGELSGFLPATIPNDQGRNEGFGNDLNWNGAIVLTPYWLYRSHGDVETMDRYWESMKLFMDYVARRRTDGQTGDDRYFVDNGLGDWAANDRSTPRAVTATSAYFLLANRMSVMAEVLGKVADRDYFADLADNVRRVYNERLFNPSLGFYTNEGPSGTATTQANQALPLDYGIVLDEHRESVLDALVDMIYDYQPHGGGPHTSGGIVGLGPIYRVLQDGDRGDVLWDMLQEDT